MSYARIRGKLITRIGCQVTFGAPKDVHEKGGTGASGTIIDEVWANPVINDAPPHKEAL